MVFKNPYLTTTTKIELLQWWIVIHSILYYGHDTSLVEDRVFDMNEVQLAKMMKENPKEAAASKYAYAFEGFDGSTGFDIPSKLNKAHKKRATDIINFILKTEKENLK